MHPLGAWARLCGSAGQRRGAAAAAGAQAVCHPGEWARQLDAWLHVTALAQGRHRRRRRRGRQWRIEQQRRRSSKRDGDDCSRCGMGRAQRRHRLAPT